jgi:hypothetical protein
VFRQRPKPGKVRRFPPKEAECGGCEGDRPAGADIDQMPQKKIACRALDSGHRVNGLLISLELIR